MAINLGEIEKKNQKKKKNNYKNVSGLQISTEHVDVPVIPTTVKQTTNKPQVTQNNDGYFKKSKGNTGQAIGYSALDALGNFTEGSLNFFEGMSDNARYAGANVLDWFGADKKAEEIRKRARENDVEDIVKQWNHITAGDISGTKTEEEIGHFRKVEENSIFGEKSDQVIQGVGNSLTGAAVGSYLGAPITGASKGANFARNAIGLTSFGSSAAGHATTEAYNEGANDFQAGVYGILNGAVEAGSEMLFGGLGKINKSLGFGTGALDDVIVKKLTKNIGNTLVRNVATVGLKSGGEGVEEIASLLGDQLIRKMMGMDSKTLKELAEDGTLADTFVQGTLSSLISQTPSGISSTVQGRDYTTGLTKTQRQYVNEIAQQRMVEAQRRNAKLNGMQKSRIEDRALTDFQKGRLADASKLQQVNLPGLSSKDIDLQQSAYKYGFNPNSEAIVTIKTMLDNRGIKSRFDADAFKNINGNAYWTNNNGVREVVFNPNASEQAILEEIALHELTHDLMSSKNSKKIINNQKILDYVSTLDGYKESRAKLEKLYSNQTKGMNKKQANALIYEEIVADTLGKNIGSQEYIRRLIDDEPSIAKNIYDWVVNKVANKNGVKNEKAYWNNVKNNFEKAYNMEYQGKGSEGNAKYSIGGEKGFNNLTEKEKQSVKWFQDKNGDWKFEFTDKDMKLLEDLDDIKPGKEYTLNELFGHNLLTKMYPSLQEYKISFESLGNTNGRHNAEEKTIKINSRNLNYNKLSNNDVINAQKFGMNNYEYAKTQIEGTLLHELQHAIQNIEGFETGRKKGSFRKAYYESLGEIEANDTKLRHILERGGKLDRNKTAPESSKQNPAHRDINGKSSLEEYLKDRKKHPTWKILDSLYDKYGTQIDKFREKAYNFFNKEGMSDEEIDSLVEAYQKEVLQKDSEKTIRNVVRRGTTLKGTSDSSFSMSKQLENQASNLVEEDIQTRNAMLDNFKSYLEEYDITNPTQEDIDNSLIDLLSYDNDMTPAETLKYEKQYKEVVNEYLRELDNSSFYDDLIADAKFHNAEDLTEVTTGYENVPDNLLGFSKNGQNKGYFEEKYKYNLDLLISVDGGKTYFEDSIKGLNYNQAIERAKRNWGEDAILKVNPSSNKETRYSLSENEKAGYDGITWVEGGRTYVPFNANAIKKVDNIKPTASEDIRYSLSTEDLKQKQLDIILKNNPVADDYHTWIRSVDDIKTYEEALQEDLDGETQDLTPDFKKADLEKALETGKMTVYSSYPIEQGIFVTPSKMEAQNFAGSEKVYSKEISLDDVAWIDTLQGQYAKVQPGDIRNSQQTEGWQSFLDNNFEAKGTKTRLSDIKLPGITNTVQEEVQTEVQKSLLPIANELKELNKNLNKVLNPNEISQLTPQDANTTPILPGINRNQVGDGKSKFFDNIKDKTNMLSDETKTAILSSDDVKYYDKVTNKESLDKAFERLQNGGANETLRWHKLANRDENGQPIHSISATDIAEGWILLKQYADNGDTENMVEVAKTLRNMGTMAGQTVQAFNIMSRLTPEGMVKYAQSELLEAYDQMVKNKSAKWIEDNRDKFELKPNEVQFIMDTMQEVSTMEDGYDKRVKLAEIQKLMTDKLPPTKGAGLKAWMRISMLFNPKTQIRNIAGNAVIAPVNYFGDLFASGVDKLISKKTGVRTTGTTKLSNYAKGFKTGLYQSYNDFKKGINTRNIEGNRFEVTEGKSFNDNNAIGKALNKVDSLLSFMLDAGDRGFYEASFVNSINNQMVLNNTTEVTQEMIDIATQEALSRTWQDNNTYSKAVLGIRKLLNLGQTYGIGDVLIPFAKTPANLTKAIVDYSPAGLVNVLVKGNNLRKSLNNGQFNAKMQHEFVQSLGKATAGTMLYVLGYALAQAGITSGASDEDKDVSNFMKNTLGVNSYSIKIGDKSFTYDWAQPIAAPLTITANVVNAQKEDKEQALTEAIVGSLDSAGSTLLEQSFLQSINDVLNNQDGVVSGLITEMLELPARAIPTLSKQIVDLTDSTQRQTFEYNKPIKSAYNYAISKIPGLSYTLDPSVDTMGREIKKYGGKNNLFNVFLNPANVSTENVSESAQEIYRLYKETGETNIMPRVAPYYVNKKGEKIILTTQQRTQYQKVSGAIIEENVANLLGSTAYQNMSDTKKAETINDIVNYSYNIAQNQVLGTELSDSYQTAYEYAQIGDISDFYEFRNSIDDTDADTKRTSIVNYLYNSDLEDNQIANLYGNYYSSDKTLNAMLELRIPMREFIKFNSADIQGQYNTNTGQTISGSKKNATIEYVNTLNLSKAQRAILVKSVYSSHKSNDNDIIRYVNTLPGTANEKKVLLKSIGFDAYDDDVFNYINSQNISRDEKIKKLKELGFTVRDGRVYY